MRSLSKFRPTYTHFLAADRVGRYVRSRRRDDDQGMLCRAQIQHAVRSGRILDPFPTTTRARDQARPSLAFCRTFAILPFEQIQRHVHNHVLLPTDHAAATQLDQDVYSFYAILLGCRFTMA